MIDLINGAIVLLQTYCPSDGYYLAFSGGKDSCVLLDIAKRAGVTFDAHFTRTSVDPPELISFIRENHPQVQIEKPDISMWGLIEINKFPPTRLMPFCCRNLKEPYGKGRVVLTGVRRGESFRRAQRKQIETCKTQSRILVHPIFEWSAEDVWQYIKENNLPYCRLYDEGFSRIGCVGCPKQTPKARRRQFERYPNFKRAYLLTFKRVIQLRKETGLKCSWNTSEELFDWWVSK